MGCSMAKNFYYFDNANQNPYTVHYQIPLDQPENFKGTVNNSKVCANSISVPPVEDSSPIYTPPAEEDTNPTYTYNGGEYTVFPYEQNLNACSEVGLFEVQDSETCLNIARQHYAANNYQNPEQALLWHGGNTSATNIEMGCSMAKNFHHPNNPRTVHYQIPLDQPENFKGTVNNSKVCANGGTGVLEPPLHSPIIPLPDFGPPLQSPLPVEGYVVRIKDSTANNRCLAVQDSDSIIGNGDDVKFEQCIDNRAQHQWFITNDIQNYNGETYRRIESMANRTKCLDYDGEEREGGLSCKGGCGAYEVRNCDTNNNHYFKLVNGDIEGATRIKRRSGNQECLDWYKDPHWVNDNTLGKDICSRSTPFYIERVI